MNTIQLKMEHLFFQRNKVADFQVQIENATVTMESNYNLLVIVLKGKSIEKLNELMLDMLSVLFLYLGGYPKIVEIRENNKIIDISNILNKFYTQDYFIKNNLAICKIDDTTINAAVLAKFKTINQLPIYSLQYLVSENYKSITSTHKITLLLHIIDGIVPDSTPGLEAEIKRKYHVNGNIGKYLPKVYYLCKYYFFNYESKFNCEILKILNETEYSFLRKITDTRNANSHFLNSNKKIHRMEDGDEVLRYFQILYYSIRLCLIDKLKVQTEENWIVEYLYCIYDWISTLQNSSFVSFKSETYKRKKAFDDFFDCVNTLKRV